MPAKDKYHDIVVNALEKDGWQIIDSPFTLLLPERRLYIDLHTKRASEEAVLIEVKVFEKPDSPMNYLANSIGQYMLYKAALDLLNDYRPLYLAIPLEAYEAISSEKFASHAIKYNGIKLVIYNPSSEEIVKWLP
jgi:hypothetical protein